MAVYLFLLKELGFKKIDKETETELINKIKKDNNEATISVLHNPYKHIIERVILLYCDDLVDIKEHKILQSKAKNAFINGVLNFDAESGFSLIIQIVWRTKQELLDYLSKRDGWKRLPMCKVPSLDAISKIGSTGKE
jgi:hypothetical protein